MKTIDPVYKNIWLAEDDLDDQEIFDDALKQILPNALLTMAANGEELLKKLNAAAEVPDILFLDINMPYQNGLSCLVEIRINRRFSKLPIVMFTGSQSPMDMEKAYDNGANLYYTKPASIKELMEGLADLCKMNWEDPFTITRNHFVNNKYTTFVPAKRM